MSGWQSQQTGDTGQAIVAAELVRAGFLVGELSPDPGEDLWAEVDGRRAIATGDFPLRALFQVKARASVKDEFVLDVEIDQLKRWAAQPLPVFVVGVYTPSAQLFVKSIDEIIASEVVGRNLFDLQQKKTRIRLEATRDFVSIVRKAIERHYEPLQLNLSEVADDEIRAHYFEVLQTRQPDGWEIIPTLGWSVLWKSAPRPQHFAAMISDLVRRALVKLASTPSRSRRCSFFTFTAQSRTDTTTWPSLALTS